MGSKEIQKAVSKEKLTDNLKEVKMIRGSTKETTSQHASNALV